MAIEMELSTQMEEHTPLYQCVEKALAKYFKHLDGQLPRNLYELVLAEMEAPLFKAVLDYTSGNQCRASEVLGINRGTLRKKLEQYQIKTKTDD